MPDPFILRITEAKLSPWRKRWPCSTLTTGYVVFDDQNGDLVGLGGALSKENFIDGHELDVFIDDHQSPELRAVRGVRTR
jgi:hypothetical protein